MQPVDVHTLIFSFVREKSTTFRNLPRLSFGGSFGGNFGLLHWYCVSIRVFMFFALSFGTAGRGLRGLVFLA